MAGSLQSLDGGNDEGGRSEEQQQTAGHRVGDNCACGEWQSLGAGRSLCRLERTAGWLSYNRGGGSRRRDLVGGPVPTALHGVVEVRPVMGGYSADQGQERVYQARVKFPIATKLRVFRLP